MANATKKTPPKKPAAAETVAQPKNAKASPAFKKTPCPISRSEFNQHAQPIEMVIGDEVLEGDPKEFSSGSLGWYINGKLSDIVINGKKVKVQVGANFTIVGSKELPSIEDEIDAGEVDENEEEEEEGDE